MTAINTASEGNLAFRTAMRPSVTECLYDQSEMCNQNKLWQANSLANVNRPPTVQIVTVHSEPKPFATETASKFGHHRLW